MKKLILLNLVFLLLFANAEAAWKKIPSGTFSWLRTVEFADQNNGWIGGSKGTLMRTTNGGKTWKRSTSFTKDTIKDFSFANALEGWALCERDIYQLGTRNASYVMRTIDGGKTWQKAEFEDVGKTRLTDLVFAKNGNGLAIGEMGTIFGLDDRADWKKQISPTVFLMNGGAFADEFVGAIVGGGGTILFTEDAGVSWNIARVAGNSKAMLRGVHFADQRQGWAVGSRGQILKTTNGGRFWFGQKAGTGANLNGVHFVNRNKGWAIGQSGTILRTLSGGNSWFFERAKTRNNLEDITVNGRDVWVVGFGGTILKNEQ